jgi:methylthioribose-1-phosphate isomerase
MHEPVEEAFSPLRWAGDRLELLDQTRLPHAEVWSACRAPADVAEAIRRLAVRGAPAIGVAAAYGLALGVLHGPGASAAERFQQAYDTLIVARPTAVNLRWALERGREAFAPLMHRRPEEAATRLLEWANGLHAADVAANRRLGEYGAALFARGDRVLTHCNTGALATAGYGTALGVVQAAWAAGRLEMVWVDETRPLLQGARLTAWELARAGIPFKLVTDSAVGALMSRALVSRVVVGADRIAANGDVANKIGTYTVAVLAHRHGVPFYVAAPLSTIDPATPNGAAIPIEERSAAEVTTLDGAAIAPAGSEAANFAFDVTPAELVSALITEAGVLEPPYGASIARALGASQASL